MISKFILQIANIFACEGLHYTCNLSMKTETHNQFVHVGVYKRLLENLPIAHSNKFHWQDVILIFG